MKEITAYKSNSGELFNTADEAKAKDLTDEIIAFVNDDREDVYYACNPTDAYRQIAIRQLAEKIVKDADKFLAIFAKVS